MGICRKCASGAVALAAGVVPIFCNHKQGHDDLPESEVHWALMEPVARLLTTSGAMSLIGVGLSSASVSLTGSSASNF